MCLRLNARLAKNFWANIVSMDCFLINRSPKVALDGKVVEQVQTSSAVNYFDLKMFGVQPIYMFLIKRSKLDAKSRWYIFLGYPKGMKEFKLQDPKANKVVISRDVIFDENTCYRVLKRKKNRCQKIAAVVNKWCKWSQRQMSERIVCKKLEILVLGIISIIVQLFRRTIKPTTRYDFKDLISYAFIISSRDPTTFQQVVHN